MATHPLLLFLLPVALFLAGAADGQALSLADHVSGRPEIEAAPGDTVLIDVRADLGRVPAAGLSLYVRVPRAFGVVVAAAGEPFEAGSLFDGAVVVRNGVVGETAEFADRLLEYAVVLGPGTTRARSGAGRVACFRLVCFEAMEASIGVHNSPVHESRLVLADGRSERSFYAASPLRITVRGPHTLVAPGSWAWIKRHRR